MMVKKKVAANRGDIHLNMGSISKWGLATCNFRELKGEGMKKQAGIQVVSNLSPVHKARATSLKCGHISLNAKIMVFQCHINQAHCTKSRSTRFKGVPHAHMKCFLWQYLYILWKNF
jgi:hypothetical protein